MRSIIILMLISSLMMTSCDRGEREMIVVPQNYTGYIIIIFNQKKGVAPLYEGKNRVYEIPRNGILKTQFPGNPGWMEFPKFYYDKIAPQNEIPYKVDYKNIPADSTVGFGGSVGNANKDLAGKETVEFKQFYIGNKAQIDSAAEKGDKLDIIKLAE